jgi:DNA repair protein RadC
MSMADLFVPACVTPGTTEVLVLHNHPSGDPTPSDADLALTRRVREPARLLGFNLLDHLIVGDHGRCYSCISGQTIAIAPDV